MHGDGGLLAGAHRKDHRGRAAHDIAARVDTGFGGGAGGRGSILIVPHLVSSRSGVALVRIGFGELPIATIDRIAIEE